MDIETFYSHLGDLLPKGFVPFMDGKLIRLRHPDLVGCYCPVTAVCYSMTGKVYNVGGLELAAEAILLDDHREAVWIQEAADNHGHPGVRTAMLQELDLKEAA